MSRHDERHEGAPTPSEREAAERLARALEGHDEQGVDGEALRVTHLLQAMAPLVNEVANQRLRRHLVAKASRHRRRFGLKLVVGVAAALPFLVGGYLVLRAHSQPSQKLLEQRQHQAAMAVAQVGSGWNHETALRSRVSDNFDSQWRQHLDSEIQARRSTQIKLQLSTAGSAVRSATTAPAGGAS